MVSPGPHGFPGGRLRQQGQGSGGEKARAKQQQGKGTGFGAGESHWAASSPYRAGRRKYRKPLDQASVTTTPFSLEEQWTIIYWPSSVTLATMPTWLISTLPGLARKARSPGWASSQPREVELAHWLALPLPMAERMEGSPVALIKAQETKPLQSRP